MKNKKTLFSLGFFFIFSVAFLFGSSSEKAAAPEQAKPAVEQVKSTPELRKEFPMKSHHAKLSFECVYCHEGQGNNPKEFTTPGDKGCLSCHKSKQYLADRLKFMDKLHVNPHNSIHDGPVLYCDECHNEHKPSINMCAECHEHDVKIWTKDTP
ncbi:cytochrome c3 family protein [Sulfurospirillum arcachonense]|uniref:cytochrome c3 family protein n=1 Tax=Sulfurospirillum arcachonense TaxID=57666 RepID=UPI00046A6B01|nr:cytochrome c3 family protein [Sulfurospirillum arcachonense]